MKLRIALLAMMGIGACKQRQEQGSNTQAGMAFNDNFTVFVPGEHSTAYVVAEAILASAEKLRKEIAIEWLGEEIPPSIGASIINLTYVDQRPPEEQANARKDHGLTWAKDAPDRRFHTVYISVASNEPWEHLLAHEITHVVLATRYADLRQSPWLEEAIACRYDNMPRKETRARLLQWLIKSNSNWPQLVSLFNPKDNILPSSKDLYAASESLGIMLMESDKSGNPKANFLEFGMNGLKLGWDKALEKHYQISSVSKLQNQWQAWVAMPGNAVKGSEIKLEQDLKKPN